MVDLNNQDCIFCKIAKKEIKSNIVFENEYVLAFQDINPVTPIHILVIPKIHIESVNDVTRQNSEYISKIFEAIPAIVKEANIFNDGYRVITNIGENGGQLVKHMHFHILGGKKLGPKIVHD